MSEDNKQEAKRICSAYKECRMTACDHRVPHKCYDKGMYMFMPCHTSGIISTCVPIKDGQIKKHRTVKCETCGHSHSQPFMENI